LQGDLINYKKQVQYLANERDEISKDFTESIHKQRENIVALEQKLDGYREQDEKNDAIWDYVLDENTDLYGFVSEVARLKKIPEGAYISKEEAEALNAVITHAKGLRRKYDSESEERVI
jgi:hypothetical protein